MTPRTRSPRQAGGRGVGPAAEETPFLGREGDEPHREIERERRQDAGRLEDGGRPAGVVVGARGQGLARGRRRGRIVVAADDDDVVGVGLSGYLGDDVAGRIGQEGEGLEADVVEAEGRERGEERVARRLAVHGRGVTGLEVLKGLDARAQVRPGDEGNDRLDQGVRSRDRGRRTGQGRPQAHERQDRPSRQGLARQVVGDGRGGAPGLGPEDGRTGFDGDGHSRGLEGFDGSGPVGPDEEDLGLSGRTGENTERHLAPAQEGPVVPVGQGQITGPELLADVDQEPLEHRLDRSGDLGDLDQGDRPPEGDGEDRRDGEDCDGRALDALHEKVFNQMSWDAVNR